jgi:hypothetical protein
VTINLNQGADAYGQVTVIDRNGFERSQLAIRSVYGLITGPDGNQTYLDPIPPLGGVGGPQLSAPILSTVDFYPTPPDELFNTPFPEKVVLGFYAATCGGGDGTLCNPNTTNASLSWRPDADTSLGNFLTGDALAAFNANNPGYFGLPTFDGNSGITVAQLRYYPQTETDPDLLETGGGRDVVTGEQGQVGLVQITFNVNGSALQEACYHMQLTAGQWKILRRLAASCAEPPLPPTPTPISIPTSTPSLEATSAAETPGPPILEAKITAPATTSICEPILFSAAGSEPVDQIVAYDWDFGDGNSGSGLNLSYRYTAPGVYTVTLTVRDNTGQTSTTHTITVNPPYAPPPSPCGPPTCCG